MASLPKDVDDESQYGRPDRLRAPRTKGAGMELAELIAALSEPAAYPVAPGSIDVRQTHISAVFLAGGVVYKLKKPVTLGFLDFSSLDRRKFFCDEEVRLNRRL